MPTTTKSGDNVRNRKADGFERVQRSNYAEFKRSGILNTPLIFAATYATQYHSGELKSPDWRAPALSAEEAGPIVGMLDQVNLHVKRFEQEKWFADGLGKKVRQSNVRYWVGDDARLRVHIGTLAGRTLIELSRPRSGESVTLITAEDARPGRDGLGPMGLQAINCRPKTACELLRYASEHFPPLRDQSREPEPVEPERPKNRVVHKLSIDRLDSRFAETDFVVRATSYEAHQFWRLTAKGNSGASPGLSWEQDNPGLWVEIGSLDGRPVGVSFTWNIVNGRRVLFWEMTSQVSDEKMAEEFLAHLNLPVPKERVIAGRQFAEYMAAWSGSHALELHRDAAKAGGKKDAGKSVRTQPDAEMVKNVAGVVLAIKLEQQLLELECAQGAFKGRVPAWRVTDEFTFKAGELLGRPVLVDVTFVALNGRRCCFVAPASTLTDHSLIDAWVDEHLAQGRDRDTCPRCNAENFHNVLLRLQER